MSFLCCSHSGIVKGHRIDYSMLRMTTERHYSMLDVIWVQWSIYLISLVTLPTC